jgi:hypothetical protein
MNKKNNLHLAFHIIWHALLNWCKPSKWCLPSKYHRHKISQTRVFISRQIYPLQIICTYLEYKSTAIKLTQYEHSSNYQLYYMIYSNVKTSTWDFQHLRRARSVQQNLGPEIHILVNTHQLKTQLKNWSSSLSQMQMFCRNKGPSFTYQ